MNNNPSSLSLDDAITAYVRSEYFTGLAAVTKSKRRGILRNMRADVLDLLGLPVTPLPALALLNTRPVPPQLQPYSGARKKPPDEPAQPRSETPPPDPALPPARSGQRPQRRSWAVA
jgi:hypothetical protein